MSASSQLLSRLALVLVAAVSFEAVAVGSSLAVAQDDGAAASADSPAFAARPVPANLIHYGLDGRRFLLSDFVTIEGEFPPMPDQTGPVIVIFGAHWCVPCHEQMAIVHANKAQLDAAGIRVVYIHVDDLDRSQERSRDEIRALIDGMIANGHFEGVQVLLGGDLALVRQWRGTEAGDMGVVDALPFMAMVAADGQIVDVCAGPGEAEAKLSGFAARFQQP